MTKNDPLLQIGLLLGSDVISNVLIDEIARVGGVTYNFEAREILRDLTRDHVWSCISRPPTKIEAKRNARSFKVLNKEALKRQRQRHQKIAKLYSQFADLLKEDLEEGPFATGLSYKMWMRKDAVTPLENWISIPRLEALSSVIAEIANPQLAVALGAQKMSGRRGRPPTDGLDSMISGFGWLYVVEGLGTLKTTTDVDQHKRQVTLPFIASLKMLIDALPCSCPKPRRSALVNRIYEEKLLRGLTQRRKALPTIEPPAIRLILARRAAVQKSFDNPSKG